MSEVDISEDLPNGDDSAFSEDQQAADENGTASHNTSGSSIQDGALPTDQVFVVTAQGLLTGEQQQESPQEIKTTHIVIHDQTLSVETDLKTPTTPLPPPTPATPLSKAKGFRYQWDTSVHCEILPVRCKATNGELHKAKFGSGGRGKCVRSGGMWYTPNEFEAASGRASSKDWKRSIRYGGRTLQCLIEDGLLQPHATSCTCAACCDDESVTGPVRLFVPYKRRKKESESGPPSPLPMKKLRTASVKSPSTSTTPTSKEAGVIMSIANGPTLRQPITVTHAESGETVHIVTTDNAGNIVSAGDAMVMTPITFNPGPKPSSTLMSMDVNEQKLWWQLEEMANNLLQQAQQLKTMVEQAKHQSLVAKETAIHQLKCQLEKEKQEAVAAVRMESQISVQRLLEERAHKELALQHALASVRPDLADKMDNSVAWAQLPGDVEEELDKDKD